MARNRIVVDDIEVTLEDQQDYSEQTEHLMGDHPGDYQVTLTSGEWGLLFASLRGAMVFSGHPGVIKILHERVYEQLPLETVDEEKVG